MSDTVPITPEALGDLEEDFGNATLRVRGMLAKMEISLRCDHEIPAHYKVEYREKLATLCKVMAKLEALTECLADNHG